MAYLGKTLLGEGARKEAREKSPFGPGFTEAEAAKGEKLEVWFSQLGDPGEDFTEFRLLDAAGNILGVKRVAGY